MTNLASLREQKELRYAKKGLALALMSVFSNTSSPLTNLANTIASPFRSAYTAVAEWFNDKQKYYQDYTGLEEENARLRQQIASMEADCPDFITN